MKRILFALMALVVCIAAQAADSTGTAITLTTATGTLHGSLLLPEGAKGPVPVALIIAGSGPTDRDGNTPMVAGKNNSLLYLAQGLAANGIASLRFDKRGIAASKDAMKTESELRFETYIADARGWMTLLQTDPRFSGVYVIGHSEGALIGLNIAPAAKGYVSLAGAGLPADLIIRKQLENQPPVVQDLVFPVLDSLKAGKEVPDVHPQLASLFRPSVQPYMISWFRHDPRTLIAALSVPVLIIQGGNDLQVDEENGTALKAAQPKARLELIPQMNHVLKLVASDDPQENVKAYSNPKLPVAPKVIETIVGFIKEK
ncbi:alpha/beta hydrolase [Flaviaesturariibacter amylovorans]|uniref:Alpha/beta hydrolase n=1 Tax=Flaviaesturariibacter amylovorans TaxID=1084520 RepID=A0ABP8H3T1_9BACT